MGTEEALDAIVEEYLEQLDVRVDALVDRLRTELPEYRSVPAEDVRASTGAIVRAALMQLEGARIDAGGVDALAELARRRVAQGFPLEALTRSIQYAARFILAELQELADRDGVEPRVMLAAQDRAWEFANAAAAVISGINREMAEDLARRDVGRRSDFLRGVLHGTFSASRIQAEAPVYGLDAAVAYHPLRARPTNRRQEDALVLAIRRSGSTQHHRAVVGVLEGDLVALAPRRPTVGNDVVVAVGEPRPLTAIREAFLATAAVLDTAAAVGRRGPVSLDDLGPLPLALEGGALQAALERRHFAGLDKEGQSGRDVEDTTRTWLVMNQRSDEVAAALHVHRNTVRYRLGRFQEITGLDMRRTDDFVTAWWLLHSRAIRRRNLDL